jgi:hypothetical protein
MKRLIYLFFILVGFQTFGQKTDFQTRYIAGLDVDLPKSWELSTQFQARFIENAATYRGTYIEVGAKKKISPVFGLIAGYRLGLVDNGTFHRYSMGFDVRKKWKKASVTLRPLAQYQQKLLNDDPDDPTDTEFHIRTRLMSRYTLSRRFETYLSGEPFINFETTNRMSQLRLMGGFKYTVSPNLKTNIFYLHQFDYSKKTTRINSILGVGLEFGIDTDKK